ncbi:membrane protein S27 [Saimiriine betaherpesvirus 4]|uniref:Membrane protein S27 n=1 Tax=Saimiriine betaherpesvirus 4 TaxID=1535247 RepID=G8XT53_9BETA|nr:membrane protein S27 [Saimiriine betaherpesvirus 4]AEV81002.1 membrane protein S27 [Saimiriine betaherpesvirus 4]
MMPECSLDECQAVVTTNTKLAAAPSEERVMSPQLSKQHKRHLCLVYLLFLAELWTTIITVCVWQIPVLHTIMSKSLIPVSCHFALTFLMFIVITVRNPEYPWSLTTSAIFVGMGIGIGGTTASFIRDYADSLSAIYSGTVLICLLSFCVVLHVQHNLLYFTLPAMLTAVPVIIIIGSFAEFWNIPSLRGFACMIGVISLCFSITSELYIQWRIPVQKQKSSMTQAARFYLTVHSLSYAIMFTDKYLTLK